MEDCKENIWTCKRKRKLENKTKQGNKGHTTLEHTVKFIKSFPVVRSRSRNTKPKNSKTNCNSYNGRNKEKSKTV